MFNSSLQPNLDSVTTIRDDGSRRFLYPADVRGRFTLARRLAAIALVAIYLLLPWIRVGGYPAVFLDVALGRFHLFGLTLAAQDLWLLFFLITGLGFSLFFVTALFGRIWCGWACPQTIFLDHVFRVIERRIEGDAMRRRALRAARWNLSKAARRTAKHAIYLGASFGIAHLFLAYFVSIPELWAMMRAAPAGHWGAFVFMAAATGALYFNFAWFREQLCIVICPYGRLQSALVDNNTIIIGYDKRRGEPRMPLSAARRLSAGERAGDCVACDRCVHVCPTGIDIRDGLQMECVGCSACIDACDDVMTRLGRPRGLIRYDSLAGLSGKATRWLRSRTLLYGALLLAGALVSAWALSTVRPAAFSVTRMIGAPYFVDRNFVRNQFLVRIVNKRTEAVRFSVRVERGPAELRQVGFDDPVGVPPLGECVGSLILEESRKAYGGPFVVDIGLRDRTAGPMIMRQVEFLGPDARLLREEEQEIRP